MKAAKKPAPKKKATKKPESKFVQEFEKAMKTQKKGALESLFSKYKA